MIETIYTPERHRVICSWCDAVIEEGTPGALISHGLCAPRIPKVRINSGLPPLPVKR